MGGQRKQPYRLIYHRAGASVYFGHMSIFFFFFFFCSGPLNFLLFIVL